MESFQNNHPKLPSEPPGNVITAYKRADAPVVTVIKRGLYHGRYHLLAALPVVSIFKLRANAWRSVAVNVISDGIDM